MKKIVFATDSNNITTAIARIILGFVLFPHGAQKLLGWFGGYGFEGTMNYFTEAKGLPWIVGFVVILIEFFGALSLIVGFATRFWAVCILILAPGIVITEHWGNGFFMNWFGNQAGEGYEYFILMAGLALVLIISGGGKWSIDARFDKPLPNAKL